MATRLIFFLLTFVAFGRSPAQDINILLSHVRARMDKVKDYQATGNLRTDVSFLKIPISRVNVFYKQPDQFRIKKEGGISLLPKGGVSFNMRSLLMTDHYTVIPSGDGHVGGHATKVVKLLPTNEDADIVLTTLYIDEQSELILRATTTTKEHGTYDMQMEYGKYQNWGLPDKVIFTFHTKDYKLPKGITFEYESGQEPKNIPAGSGNKMGKVEITYDNYLINKGVPESVFQ